MIQIIKSKITLQKKPNLNVTVRLLESISFCLLLKQSHQMTLTGGRWPIKENIHEQKKLSFLAEDVLCSGVIFHHSDKKKCFVLLCFLSNTKLKKPHTSA